LTVADPIRLRFWEGRGLTMPQLRLMYLVWLHGGQSAGEIAERMIVSPATVTGLTARLLKQGLVRREEDSDDRRLKRFWLTPDGDRLLGQISVAADAYMEAVMSRLSDDVIARLAESLGAFNEAAEAVQREAETGV
jgi:DNA-binding MarR family transcriptional regulator